MLSYEERDIIEDTILRIEEMRRLLFLYFTENNIEKKPHCYMSWLMLVEIYVELKVSFIKSKHVMRNINH